MINHADAWADFQTIKEMAGIRSDLNIHDLRASRVTQWATEGDRPKSEAELAAIIGSRDVKGLIRVYVRDSASEEEKRARVNAADDVELVSKGKPLALRAKLRTISVHDQSLDAVRRS